MNVLSPITDATWVGDGAEQTILTSDSQSTATVEALMQGRPSNILLDANITSSSFFFEILIVSSTDSSPGVGLVKKDSFEPGWKTNGMFYNGNVTNGSGGLIIGFGPRLTEGDRLGIYARRDLGNIDVSFYVNGRCLGTAFSLTDDEELYYPCIHVSSGKVVFEYTAPEEFPSVTDQEREVFEDIYSGEWKLTRASSGPELGEIALPEESDTIFTFMKKDDKNYDLSVKVGNTFATRVKLVGKMEEFDKIKVMRVGGTRMMPPPTLRPVETIISSRLSKMQKMIISEDENLTMVGPEAEFFLKKYMRTFSPVTKY